MLMLLNFFDMVNELYGGISVINGKYCIDIGVLSDKICGTCEW